MYMTNGVYIIAEAGVNHNGSLEMAKNLISAAKEAGANAIKFQTFKAEYLVRKQAPTAEYQKLATGQNSQYEMLKSLELNEAIHRELVKVCLQTGIDFLSTPFDFESLDLLAHQLDLPLIKIPSGEITNAPLLLKTALTGKRVILSTGMSTLGEIEMALGVLAFGYLVASGLWKDEKPSITAFQNAYFTKMGQLMLKERVSLLHCTTEYPAPFGEVNLNSIGTMKHAFGLPIGYSDHTEGLAISIAAVARGAVIVEKHLTLDRELPGPDHKASLEPAEFKMMVEAIRQVEMALGVGQKVPSPTELKNLPIARKSLITTAKVKRGEKFSQLNLGVKRPGTGISPVYYWDWLGKLAERDYEVDEEVGK